jgi:vanillate O-demethylase monooxygenase subunit
MPMTFVKNAWYMAGWASELGQTPRAITMLNDPVVLFRGEDGVAGALLDVCPHRAVPLSLGTVAGNHIVCPYHGIELDRGAVCRRTRMFRAPPTG